MKSRKSFSFRNNQGFTLVELMITLAMSGIIVAAIYSAYIIQQKTYYTQGQVVEMQQNIRAGLEMMVGEMRIATYDPDAKAGASIITATSSKFDFTSDLSSDGLLKTAGIYQTDEHVIFCLQDPAGDADGCDLDGIANGGTASVIRNGQAIADGIQRIELYYTLDDGLTKTLAPSAAQLAKIQTVQITLLAVSSQRDPKYTDTNTYFPPATIELIKKDFAPPFPDPKTIPDPYSNPKYIKWVPLDLNFRHRLLSTSVKLRNHGLN